MSETAMKLIVRVVISLGLMGGGLFILASPTIDGELEKAAIGWIGLVTGYWLR